MDTNKIDETRIDKARLLADQLLQTLREERDIRLNAKQPGGRELSEAITCIETGSMFFIRSLFAAEPYSPTKKLQPVPQPGAAAIKPPTA